MVGVHQYSAPYVRTRRSLDSMFADRIDRVSDAQRSDALPQSRQLQAAMCVMIMYSGHLQTSASWTHPQA